MKRIVGILFVTALMPTMVSALDIQALLAQIDSLRAQVLVLQSAQTQPLPGDTKCDLPSRLLGPGATGDHVKRLQEFLARDQTVYPERLVTGYYGNLTIAAVRRWQKRFSIMSSGSVTTNGFGVVGQRTLDAMRNVWCIQSQMTPSPFTIPKNLTATTGVTVAPLLTSPIAHFAFLSPSASTTIFQGNSLFISWKSDTVPANAVVSLALKTKFGTNVGFIKGNLSQNGSYYWTIPTPPSISTGTCTDDPITCLAQIAGVQNDCTGLCSVASGLYKISGDISAGGSVLVSSESRIFSVGGAALSAADISGIDFSNNINATSSYSNTLYTNNTDPVWQPVNQSTPGLSCTYSGVPYSEGITVTINCADVRVPGVGCGSYGGMQMTCRSGQWLDVNGIAQSIRNVTNISTAGACRTPWQSQVVANGNEVPYEPFFTNGNYTSTGPVKLMKCSGGSWQMCDTVGANCH